VFIAEHDGRPVLVTSASDLTAASACEFAFLRRVDAKLGRDVEVPPDDDAMLARAARLGDAHEARVLAGYRAEFGEGGSMTGRPGVVEIPRPESMRSDALREAADQTLDALRGDAEVVFQATFFDPAQRPADAPGGLDIAFVGFADFLRRTEAGAYEIQDAKLARRARVTALMQLAAYAEQLERIGVPVASEATLILGDGARSAHRLADIGPVFRSRRARLHEILLGRARAAGPDGRRETAEAVAWGASDVSACGRCGVCGPEAERARDPLLIAGITRTQRDRLMAAGFDTVEKVASAVRADGIAPAVLSRIAAQAELQLRAESGRTPPFAVIDPSALSAIPEPNAGDLFFDFEGDPLFREAGGSGSSRWGIDYLFGTVDCEERFTALWAHDLDAEREALMRFLGSVADRRRRYPGMRIFHYASYERTHLLSIAARHGVGEAEVDQLLREHVLIDLYPIVRRALRVGSRSYSIKKLEPLYMGDELRDEDGVTDAAQSVTEYAEASELLRSGDPAERREGRRRLDAIADYNRYDCVSTLRLRDWLLRLAAEHGIPPRPPDAPALPEAQTAEASAAGAELMRLSQGEAHEQALALRLAASAIDYHQREQKSFWWAHFARLVDPIEDWADTRDVLMVDESSSGLALDWHLPERSRVERRHLRLRGAIAPGSSLAVGSEMFALYDLPAPFPAQGGEPGGRTARKVRIVGRLLDGVTVEEMLPRDSRPYAALPLALTPGPPPPAGRQKGAIEEWGRGLISATKGRLPYRDPVFNLLLRQPPRLAGRADPVPDSSGEALAAAGGDERARLIGAVIASLRLLDRSALAVQGPPGTGKTYLAARVIRTLVERDGWCIGVVAQSHRVVENVLHEVVEAGLDAARVGKVPQGGRLDDEAAAPNFTVLRTDGHHAFLNGHRAGGRGAVIGGTAWDFANETRIGRRSLDLLVIDEAGQFSLAPTIAASVAAQRLLLLGDPQQLPQVSQGSHPEPIDTSALGWYLGEHGTLPDTMGYFLAETRRMRPELTSAVSGLSYDGRLRAHESTVEREVTDAGPAGLVWHPVEHSGNSTSSVEEAEEVARIARAVLVGSLQVSGRRPRRLAETDLIVVAAYNAQVEVVGESLAAAGLHGIRVGTVDKFQGQEAVIAIVTLAASSAEDIPRGVEFLLMRNRLNVAISRAQWAAHLVSSPRLGGGLPRSAEGVVALSGYLGLLERSTAAPPPLP